MVARTTHVPSPSQSRPHTILAAALFTLAGTPAGLAQFSLSPPAEQPGGVTASPIRDPLGQEPLEIGDGVKVNEHMLVDIHVQDEDLATVLQMLSIQAQKNIVASKNVSATVTANFYGVSFFEALDGILHVNGYGYIERGNFVYVYTLEELAEIERAARQVVHRVVHLNYLNSTDAAEFAKPLLSPDGQIKTNGKVEAFNIPDSAPVGGEDFAHESTLVVIDYEENVAQVLVLLGELDTRPAQVLIEATILQTALNEANAFGVDFTILGSIDFADFVGVGGPRKVIDNLIGGKGATLSGPTQVPEGNGYGSGIQSTPGNTDGRSTMKLGLISGDFAAFVRLLDEVTDTTILSRPNLLTLNRQPARVLVGRKVGYLNTTSTDTATTQTVEFLDTGTQLYVRPFVSSDGTIRMELKPQVSEAIIREATDATGAAVTIPDEITNELVANVMVRDGQTIVLGGLFRESTEATRRQVPFLGDVPLIGPAFRGHEDETQRSEIIFMITPSLVNDEILVEQGRRATAFVGNARTGAREGLLPFSQEKQAGQLLVQAQQQAARGETEAALLSIRRSLALRPQQAEAIALRERLLKDNKVWPNRSLLDEVLHGEVESMLRNAPAPGASAAPTAPSPAPAAAPAPEPQEHAEAPGGEPLLRASITLVEDWPQAPEQHAAVPESDVNAPGLEDAFPQGASDEAPAFGPPDPTGPFEPEPAEPQAQAVPPSVAASPASARIAASPASPRPNAPKAPAPATATASGPTPEPFTFAEPGAETGATADDIRLLLQLAAAEWLSFNNRSDWPIRNAAPDSPAAPSDRRRGDNRPPSSPATTPRTAVAPNPDDPEPSEYTQAVDPPEPDSEPY